MTEAMRANSGKPKLSYLLSFKDGIAQLLPTDGWYGISRWYRGDGTLLADPVRLLLAGLPDDWPDQMARVCDFGAQKYARGNYLLGRAWSDTCDSLLRHALAERNGEEKDAESGIFHYGHIAWNLLYLLHCVETGIGTDDRLRPPAVSTAAPVPPDARLPYSRHTEAERKEIEDLQRHIRTCGRRPENCAYCAADYKRLAELGATP